MTYHLLCVACLQTYSIVNVINHVCVVFSYRIIHAAAVFRLRIIHVLMSSHHTGYAGDSLILVFHVEVSTQRCHLHLVSARLGDMMGLVYQDHLRICRGKFSAHLNSLIRWVCSYLHLLETGVSNIRRKQQSCKLTQIWNRECTRLWCWTVRSEVTPRSKWWMTSWDNSRQDDITFGSKFSCNYHNIFHF